MPNNKRNNNTLNKAKNLKPKLKLKDHKTKLTKSIERKEKQNS